jgi:hypothetical protein
MTYTCQNCGSAADNPSDLCNPQAKEQDSKICGASAVEVCAGKVSSMQYTCDACGQRVGHPRASLQPQSSPLTPTHRPRTGKTGLGRLFRSSRTQLYQPRCSAT